MKLPRRQFSPHVPLYTKGRRPIPETEDHALTVLVLRALRSRDLIRQTSHAPSNKKRTAMPGTYVTDQQPLLFMSKRKHPTREVTAVTAGMSVRTAGRIEHAANLEEPFPRVVNTWDDWFVT